MPDWSYQTIFRPGLFRLPARRARGLTLRAMRNVSLLPGGTLLIKTLGHMDPAPILASRLSGTTLPTPVGLSGAVDPEGIAARAIAQLGFGFVEVGPITPDPITDASPIRMDRREETIVYPSAYENVGAEAALRRIRNPGHRLPQLARIAPMPETNPEQAIDELRSLVDRFMNESRVSALIIEAAAQGRSRDENERILRQIASCIREQPASETAILLYIPLELPETQLAALVGAADPETWSGFFIGDYTNGPAGATVGRTGKAASVAKLSAIRAQAAGTPLLFASAGVHEPADALDLIEAGADYVLLHSGFVYSGPGLPKRVNEAIIHRKLAQAELPAGQSFWRNWGWMCLLGIGMIIGGIIAWFIASTSVLLPYDEAFLRMTWDEVNAIDPHLLHFMSHDRITLAGTMLSIGILYCQLAKHGLRYGVHWARVALLASGAAGFPSFFLYLGYGFFDPVHAAAAIVLFPMFLLAMRRNPDRLNRDPVNLRNSLAWRRALWGQLCFVVVGAALCVGGIVIASVGVTNVFVPEDIRYLGMARESLDLANPRLIPLIAHDRAGFGGALFSDAVMILIFALWGLRQGAKWMWWTLLWGGAPGFVAGLSVHFMIGYTDFVHLLPAYFVFALYIAGLALLYPYLMRSEINGAVSSTSGG
ncbi:dihydroorotate dehydrogenase [Paenibacillus glycinis]|uniref:Dihydroorotate dehydrogenase n=1 Tax=Paenibacillus glycinis TaxID=2697035 RepID=A0ABW9XY58_9BACL|nr:hypothetical protein [Paenibacillus glycinis]NBD27176.1 hypothetical protein [Paenibacillus glycinis]